MSAPIGARIILTRILRYELPCTGHFGQHVFVDGWVDRMYLTGLSISSSTGNINLVHLLPSDCGLVLQFTVALYTTGGTGILQIFEQVFKLVLPFGSSEILDIRLDHILVIVPNFRDDRGARCNTIHFNFEISPWECTDLPAIPLVRTIFSVSHCKGLLLKFIRETRCGTHLQGEH